jgi:WD40 repeat protein
MAIKKGPLQKQKKVASFAKNSNKNNNNNNNNKKNKNDNSDEEIDDDDFNEDAAQKTYVPDDHEIPTSSQLASAKSSLLPFVASKESSLGNVASATGKRKAQQLLEEDTDEAGIVLGENNNNNNADDDDDADFDSGIVLSREAHEHAQTRKDLIAEARMRRGLEITEIADRIDISGLALFGRKTPQQQEDAAAATASQHQQHRFWGHNRNTITSVAATPPNLVVHTALAGMDGIAAAASNINPEDIEIQAETGWSTGSKMLCCFGDKAGRTWVILDDATADKPRVALDPPQRGAVLCVAISDAPPAPTLSNERISLVATKMERYIIAAGASDGTIAFWSGITLQHRGQVSLHRQPVTGLAFKAGSHVLYSVSRDAVLRVWDALEAPARSVDKLYGHTAAALCVASPSTSFLESANTTRQTAGGGRCISGGEDRVPRFWKIEAATESEFKEPLDVHNENRLNFSAGAVECCCIVGTGGGNNNLAFAVGTSNGTLALYDANKRTPLWMVERAHGSDVQGDGTGLEGPMQILNRQIEKRNNNNNNEQQQQQNSNPPIRKSGSGNPITALAAVPCGDVVASGSGDGFVRLWKVTFDEGRVSRIGVASATKVPVRMDLLCEIKTPGWVNGLSFSYANNNTNTNNNNKQWYLYVTSSKEQRLGRWTVFSKVLNGVLRFPLLSSTSSSSSRLGAVGKRKNNNNNKVLPHQNDHDDEEDEEIEEDFITSVQSQKSLAQLRNKFLQSPEKRSMTKSQKTRANKKAAKSSLGQKEAVVAQNDDDADDEEEAIEKQKTDSPKKKLSLEEKKRKLLLLRKKKLMALKKK